MVILPITVSYIKILSEALLTHRFLGVVESIKKTLKSRVGLKHGVDKNFGKSEGF